MYNEGSPFAASIFFLGGVLTLLFLKRVFGSYVSPPSIYAGLWFFSLCLFYLGVIVYYALEWQTLLVFLFTIFTFVIGALMSKNIIKRNNINSQYGGSKLMAEIRQLKWTIYILFVLGVLGSITYYFKFHSLIGIESLWFDPRTVRFEESMGALRRTRWIGLIRSFMIPSFVLTIIYLRIKPLRYAKYMLIVGIVSFFALIMSSGRIVMISLVVWSGLSTIYLAESIGKPISFRKYGLSILGVGLLFAAYFIATTNLLDKGLSYVYLTKMASRLPDALVGLADIIHYMVGSFPAFQSLIDSSEEFSQSVSLTFGVLSRIMHEIDPSQFGYPDYVQPFVFVPTPTNIYTYLDAFYLDFGWFGVAIFPFLTGFVTTSLYLWMRRSPSILKVYIVSLMGLCIFQSTGVNRFWNFQTWVWIAFPLGLLKLLGLFLEKQPKHKHVHNQIIVTDVRAGPLFRNTQNKS